MSVYKHPRSPFWQYEIQWRGHRIFGSTKQTNRRDAETVARTEIEREKQRILASEKARTSLRLDDVFGRYWQEVGQHHVGAPNTWHELELLLEFLGPDKLITEITGNDVARLVAWRRGHRARGKLITPLTVNNTTVRLKAIFSRCKVWGARFEAEPRWRDHWLRAPAPPVRELIGNEAKHIEAATRPDVLPFIRFAMASGLRLTECLLKWSEVDWDARRIRKQGKGGRTVGTAITPLVREIL